LGVFQKIPFFCVTLYIGLVDPKQTEAPLNHPHATGFKKLKQVQTHWRKRNEFLFPKIYITLCCYIWCLVWKFVH